MLDAVVSHRPTNRRVLLKLLNVRDRGSFLNPPRDVPSLQAVAIVVDARHRTFVGFIVIINLGRGFHTFFRILGIFFLLLIIFFLSIDQPIIFERQVLIKIAVLIPTAVVIARFNAVILLEQKLAEPTEMMHVFCSLKHPSHETKRAAHHLLMLFCNAAILIELRLKQCFGLEHSEDSLSLALSDSLNIVDVLTGDFENSLELGQVYDLLDQQLPFLELDV